MNNILDDMIARSHERAEKWTPIYLANQPDVMTLGEIALIGSHSYCLSSSKKRIVWNAIQMSDDAKETPSAIARDYLTIEYKQGPRISKGQSTVTNTVPPMPNVAKPREFEHGVYVDIKSCYWSIMEIIGWDVDYFPGRWLSPGRPPKNFPFPSHKVARNCLISTGRLGVVNRYIPDGKFDEIKIGNRLANTQLIRLISDMLNSIASQAVDAGAVYCNNDGFIAPDLKIAGSIIGIISDWGLTATVKGEGKGGVRSAGAYRTGSYKSLPYDIRRDSVPVSTLFPPPYRSWLQKRFAHFAS